MAQAYYKDTSPWKATRFANGYLDTLSIRPIPAESDDVLYEIAPQYKKMITPIFGLDVLTYLRMTYMVHLNCGGYLHKEI